MLTSTLPPESARRAIIVGDVHATPSELRDCRALVAGLGTLRGEADTIVFLGDQFHTHAVLHLDVVDFWVKAVRGLRSLGFRVVMLVGNHDIEASGQLHPNAVETLAGTGVIVVDKPTADAVYAPGILWMPYYHDTEAFVRDANDGWPTIHSTLICHQTFQGAQYDNGFYASDGVDANRLQFDQIISGHIHTAANFGKVCYIGSPRWRTADDANKQKHVVVFDMYSKKIVKAVPTSTWCSPIINFDLTPETEQPEMPTSNARITVTLRGPADWVRAEADRYKQMGCAVRRLPDVVAAPRIRESAPVNDSFATFLRNFRTPNGTAPAVLESLVKQCQK